MDRKARISDIKRFAVHDGDGIRTTVFFKGCSLKCVWCHNPEGIGFRPQIAYYENKCIDCGECTQFCSRGSHRLTGAGHFYDRTSCVQCGECAAHCLGSALIYYGREITVEELLPLLLEDRDFYETSGGGVTLSGGECLMQADFCAKLLRRLKENGIHTAVDTCGFVPRESFNKVLPWTDVFLYDLKAWDEEAHIRCTGHSNRRILENLRYLDAKGASLELRIPYVPEYNDDQMEKIAEFARTLNNVRKVKILPYHRYAGSKYDALGMENTLPETLPEDAAVEKIKQLFDI
ncbi:MAG: glycyl-radical enzyme activating protein [Clostridia bacterium]|nr:glycyl-radical enzyme activating protein [Clostridia bacterium]